MIEVRDYAGELDARRLRLLSRLRVADMPHTARMVEGMSDAEVYEILPTLWAGLTARGFA